MISYPPFLSLHRHNRKNSLDLAILNYNSFDYPREKLEWIIVDDTTEGEFY